MSRSLVLSSCVLVFAVTGCGLAEYKNDGPAEVSGAVPMMEESPEESSKLPQPSELSKPGPTAPVGVNVKTPLAIRRQVERGPKLFDSIVPKKEAAGLIDETRRKQIRQEVLRQAQRKTGNATQRKEPAGKTPAGPGLPSRNQ